MIVAKLMLKYKARLNTSRTCRITFLVVSSSNDCVAMAECRESQSMREGLGFCW